MVDENCLNSASIDQADEKLSKNVKKHLKYAVFQNNEDSASKALLYFQFN